MSFRPLPVMTVLTLAGLVILVMLGNWQYERFTDKRFTVPAQRLPTEEIAGTVPDLGEVRVQHVYGLADSEPIWRRYVPLTLDGTNETVLVMRDATGGPRPVPMRLAAGERVEARGRLFERDSRVSARNRPELDTWYVFDLVGLRKNYGLGPNVVRVAEPERIIIRNADDLTRTRQTDNPYGAPQPIDDLPPERHFGYAITWWGLAVALFVMYLVFHASQGRLSFRSR